MKVSAERLEALIASELVDATRANRSRKQDAMTAFAEHAVRAKEARKMDLLQQRLTPLTQAAGVAVSWAAQNVDAPGESERRQAMDDMQSAASNAEALQRFGFDAVDPSVPERMATHLANQLANDFDQPRAMAKALADAIASGAWAPKPMRAGEAEAEGRLAGLYQALLQQLNRPSRA